jgi:predicted AlkP superfamily phosphohydrolase/phosphomutase
MMTGTYPITSGVADGPMHVIGKPLNTVAIGGFRSVARKNKAAWSMFEQANDSVAIVSIPGSTPPETSSGVILKGRWANWGPDYAALVFEEEQDSRARASRGLEARFFGLFNGAALAVYNKRGSTANWTARPASYSPAFEVDVSAYGASAYAYVYDSTNDNRTNYDRVAFSRDRKAIDATLSEGTLSDWQPITLKFTSGNLTSDVATQVKYEVIKLDPDGFYKLRLIYNTLNEFNTKPSSAAANITSAVGPMVDFVDNFPAQLVYYDEDRQAYLAESNLSFEWHTKMIPALVETYKPTVVIHDIYNPTQMMTSRWWMAAVDPASARYSSYTEAERNQSWAELFEMYRQLDVMAGKILEESGDDTFIVLSSDHGNIPLDRTVNLNNLFAQKGWLKFTVDNRTGEPSVDWKASKVIYLKMAHVYINPQGLDGNYTRLNTTEYYALRDQVIAALSNLSDSDGTKPVEKIVKWEDVNATFHMPAERTGDLVIANKPGYGWSERMSFDLEVFSTPLITGYKQAVIADDVPGMWSPFMISGPGIRKGYYLGDKPYSVIDELPTILAARNISAGQEMDGKPIDAVFED